LVLNRALVHLVERSRGAEEQVEDERSLDQLVAQVLAEVLEGDDGDDDGKAAGRRHEQLDVGPASRAAALEERERLGRARRRRYADEADESGLYRTCEGHRMS